MEWLVLGLNLIFLFLIWKYLMDIVLVFWGNIFYGVPYVPTRQKLLRELMRKLTLKRGQKALELGSGDGRVAVMLARHFPIKVLGVERMRWLLWSSRVRAFLTPFKKGEVRFERRDLFKMSLRGYDLVYMYLLPVMMERLRERLEKQLRKGAMVVSFDYPLLSKKFLLWEEIGKRQKIRIYKKK